MGFQVKIYDEFTTNDTVNKAILGLSILRLFSFFIIFLLNLNQTIQEIFITLSKKKRFLKNPRFFTYLSITIYPFTRLFMIGVFLGVDKNIDNGGYTVAISIWGTLFQYLEWTFISFFWSQILYTFFIMNEVIIKNKRRVWIGVWIIVTVLFIWTIVQTVFNFYYIDIMNSSYGAGQVVICSGIGSFYLLNGVLLYRAIKNTGTKNTQLEQSFRTIKQLSLGLLIMVVSLFALFVIQVPILGLGDYETNNYIFYLFQCLLEYTQLSIVMYSLGGNSFRNYFSIKRIKEIRTGSNKTNSGGGVGNNNNTIGNSSHSQSQSNINEINMDDYVNNQNPTTNNDSNNTVSISINSSINTSSSNLIV